MSQEKPPIANPPWGSDLLHHIDLLSEQTDGGSEELIAAKQVHTCCHT